MDRSTPMGKRDYAILLLAVRLGMRASDIRLLCLPDIDFKNRKISYIQFKTDVPQTLSLLPEIEDALRDYIENGRPKTDEPYIFLTYRKTQLSIILSAPSANALTGQRDITLLSVLYATGARAQELCDIIIKDISFSVPTKINLNYSRRYNLA